MKVDRGTADEPKQLWRGRRGRSTLALIFAIFWRGNRVLATLHQSECGSAAEVGIEPLGP